MVLPDLAPFCAIWNNHLRIVKLRHRLLADSDLDTSPIYQILFIPEERTWYGSTCAVYLCVGRSTHFDASPL